MRKKWKIVEWENEIQTIINNSIKVHIKAMNKFDLKDHEKSISTCQFVVCRSFPLLLGCRYFRSSINPIHTKVQLHRLRVVQKMHYLQSNNPKLGHQTTNQPEKEGRKLTVSTAFISH